MAQIIFWEYELLPPEDGEALIAIGERIKKGTYRPCVATIPFSTISGALRQRYARNDIYAVGFFEAEPERIRLDHSANDRAVGGSDLPLTTEALVNPKGKVYVLIKNSGLDLSAVLDEKSPISLAIGALKSKGLGRCLLRKIGEKADPKKELGELRARIPEENAGLFGIEEIDVYRPVYGYLFKPTSIADGVYVRSLFEGSVVRGYEFLLKEIRQNG